MLGGHTLATILGKPQAATEALARRRLGKLQAGSGSLLTAPPTKNNASLQPRQMLKKGRQVAKLESETVNAGGLHVSTGFHHYMSLVWRTRKQNSDLSVCH